MVIDGKTRGRLKALLSNDSERVGGMCMPIFSVRKGDRDAC